MVEERQRFEIGGHHNIVHGIDANWSISVFEQHMNNCTGNGILKQSIFLFEKANRKQFAAERGIRQTKQNALEKKLKYGFSPFVGSGNTFRVLCV